MEDENNKSEPGVQAEDNSVAVGGITIGGDLSGEVNIASGHIVHAEKGSTVIIGASAEAVSGLSALRDLMRRSSDVRTAVVSFQNDFRIVHEQLDRLGDYKDVHDLLHRLQIHCYNEIVQAARYFPDDMAIDNLTEYKLTLEATFRGLKQVATRPSMPKHELGWIDELDLAKADLLNAIELQDESSLKKVIWRLNRVISVRPSRINILLNQSARALRLPALLGALKIVCETLTSLDLDTNKVIAFQNGVDALGTLDQKLSSLVEEHDCWQSVEVDLRLMQTAVDGDPREFELSWQDVRLRAEPLYTPLEDDWATSLRRECSALDAALTDSNPVRLRRSFRSYHRQVMERFFQVDVNLKALCGEMRKIGMPLASVLEVIQ